MKKNEIIIASAEKSRHFEMKSINEVSRARDTTPDKTNCSRLIFFSFLFGDSAMVAVGARGEGERAAAIWSWPLGQHLGT